MLTFPASSKWRDFFISCPRPWFVISDALPDIPVPVSLSLLPGTVLPAKLDAYYAKLCGLTGDALHYILDPASIMARDYPSETFRMLKTRNCEKIYG